MLLVVGAGLIWLSSMVENELGKAVVIGTGAGLVTIIGLSMLFGGRNG